MKRAVRVVSVVSLAASLGACGGCSEKRSDPPPAPSAAPSALATPEVLPRCRADGARVAIEGEDVVVGDAALSPSGMLVGLVRRKNGKRLGAVLRAAPDLGGARVIDVAPSAGDDPPPLPRWKDGAPHVAFLVRKEVDSGTTRGMRELRLAKLADDGIGELVATVTQQADESTAYDVAWPLAAWDEDALVLPGKFLPERGVVRVQRLPDGKPRTVSPADSDAEGPKLAKRRGGGFWLAWLARRAEPEDAGWQLEGAGDVRAWRWVEVLALDANGEPASPVKRVSSEKGHAVAFDIASSDPELVIVVQDESEAIEGAGSRLVRHVASGDRVAAADVVDGGVGHALAEVVAAEDAGWIAWKDHLDHAWLAPSTAAAVLSGAPTAESALDGARIVAAAAPGAIYVTNGGELRRLSCSR